RILADARRADGWPVIMVGLWLESQEQGRGTEVPSETGLRRDFSPASLLLAFKPEPLLAGRAPSGYLNHGSLDSPGVVDTLNGTGLGTGLGSRGRRARQMSSSRPVRVSPAEVTHSRGV